MPSNSRHSRQTWQACLVRQAVHRADAASGYSIRLGLEIGQVRGKIGVMGVGGAKVRVPYGMGVLIHGSDGGLREPCGIGVMDDSSGSHSFSRHIRD